MDTEDSLVHRNLVPRPEGSSLHQSRKLTPRGDLPAVACRGLSAWEINDLVIAQREILRHPVTENGLAIYPIPYYGPLDSLSL